MNIDQASGPRMPRIKKLVLRDPVGVPSSCCTTASERIGLCTWPRRFPVRFIRPESFFPTRSSAGFTITTSGFEFSVHTGAGFFIRRDHPPRASQTVFAQLLPSNLLLQGPSVPNEGQAHQR